MSAFLSNSWLALVLAMVAAYLMGSTNWAIIITKIVSNKDIRDSGSGNAGATNVLRTQGPVFAALTLLLDSAKGILATLLGGWLLANLQLNSGAVENMTAANLTLLGQYFASFFCVLGHLYPIFHGFRGGKGVAATMGILGVLDWRIGLICLAIFLITIASSRMVSLGSVLAMAYVPSLTFALRYWVDKDVPLDTVIFCTVVSGLVAITVIIKHGANMRRIINGTESRLGESSKGEADQKTEE